MFYKQIRDGDNPNSPLMGTYCGTDIPADLTSTGNSLYLRFKTDEAVEGTGFRLSYERISGGYSLNCGYSLEPSHELHFEQK